MRDRCHDALAAEAVGRALRLIPPRVRQLVGCAWAIGVDPVFAGIHRWPDTEDGRSFAETAHCLYPSGQRHRPAADRLVRVVLPTYPARRRQQPWWRVRVVVHELGHVLDWRLGFTHTAEPLNDYAATNRWEAFAEAFTAWVWGHQLDARTKALLDELAG